MIKIKRILVFFGALIILIPFLSNLSIASAKNSKITFEKIDKFEVYKDGTPILIDDEGTIYYIGKNDKGSFIYTLNDKNKKYKNVFNFTDKNGKIVSVGNLSMKQCGEYIYVDYNSSNQCKLVQLDKKLKKINEYDMSKNKNFDTNGKKTIYLKNSKTIYISNINGKNKKKLYIAGNDNNLQWIDHIALTDRYAGFIGSNGYGSDTKYYCGIIDLKNGKSKLYNTEQPVTDVKSYNNQLLWIGDYMKYGGGYFDSRYLYTYDGELFNTIKLGAMEGHCTIDNEGKIITFEKLENNDTYIRVYCNGELVGEYNSNEKYCHRGCLANGGNISLKSIYEEPGHIAIISYSE